MRILYVIEHLSVRGGLERILTSKMNALAERGHEVMLLTIWKEDFPMAFPIDERVRQYCLDIDEPCCKLAYPMTLLRVLRRFNRTVEEIRPDVTILFRAVGAWIAGWTSWQGRLVFESHGARWSNNHLWLYPRMERRVESVVCLTLGDAAEYKRARRVAVIPNFTDIEPKGVPDYESHRCVFVGRPCPEKNIERLERLWAKVRQTHPDWVLERHAQTEDMASAYQRGSILVMTSRSEGFPMSLVEAQRCGLPCVAFDCKYGPAEIIVDGETGYVIPYDDDEAFVEKLKILMDDVALRRRMGEAAIRNVMRYDKEKIIAEWENFLS
jgi:glycosyltransferase involved in cell wall biosynthesis